MDIYDLDDFDVVDKNDGTPVTLADKVSHDVLSSSLKLIDNDIPILSEEGDSYCNNSDLFWLIDPLDGTKEFINRNGEFTVNVALIENGIPILGVVAAPAIDETFIGFADQAYKIINKEKSKIASRKQLQEFCLVTVSKSHKSEKDQLFIDLCQKEFSSVQELPTGSSLKLCRVAEGEADIYNRLGPTYQWDIAAGHIIVNEAGGRVNTFENIEINYNKKEDLLNPQFYAIGNYNFRA